MEVNSERMTEEARLAIILDIHEASRRARDTVTYIEEQIAKLTVELKIEKISLEVACWNMGACKKGEHHPESMPEYWRGVARKKLEDERK